MSFISFAIYITLSHLFNVNSIQSYGVKVVGMTLQIRNLSNHMKNNIKDQVTKRALQQLIGRRRRMMLVSRDAWV